ncbi:MAG: acetoacetate decarboxylase family protein [Nitrospirae bacterium]|nr:acetoacetate decarboxylase family protein [Nitrospirota bacterium]
MPKRRGRQLMDGVLHTDPGCFVLCESDAAQELRRLVPEPLEPGRRVLLMLNRYPEGLSLGNSRLEEVEPYSESIICIETDKGWYNSHIWLTDDVGLIGGREGIGMPKFLADHELRWAGRTFEGRVTRRGAFLFSIRAGGLARTSAPALPFGPSERMVTLRQIPAPGMVGLTSKELMFTRLTYRVEDVRESEDVRVELGNAPNTPLSRLAPLRPLKAWVGRSHIFLTFTPETIPLDPRIIHLPQYFLPMEKYFGAAAADFLNDRLNAVYSNGGPGRAVLRRWVPRRGERAVDIRVKGMPDLPAIRLTLERTRFQVGKADANRPADLAVEGYMRTFWDILTGDARPLTAWLKGEITIRPRLAVGAHLAALSIFAPQGGRP